MATVDSDIAVDGCRIDAKGIGKRSPRFKTFVRTVPRRVVLMNGTTGGPSDIASQSGDTNVPSDAVTAGTDAFAWAEGLDATLYGGMFHESIAPTHKDYWLPGLVGRGFV